MSGKGSARRMTSSATKYAAGWDRVFGRKRAKRDPSPGKGTPSGCKANTQRYDIVNI